MARPAGRVGGAETLLAQPGQQIVGIEGGVLANLAHP